MTDAPNSGRYRTGWCDAMAIALHRRTGLPLALWTGHSVDKDGMDWDERAHAVVVDRENNRWLDVDGWHKGTPDNLIFSQPPTRISLQPATEEDVRFAFTTEGVSQEDILRADQDLVALGLNQCFPKTKQAVRRPK